MRIFLIFVIITIFGACASSQNNNFRVNEGVGASHIIALPIQPQKHGLLMVGDIRIEGRPMTFIVDTGATQSAVFKSSLDDVLIETDLSEEKMVHGIVESAKRSVARIPNFSIGKRNYKNFPLVILEDRNTLIRGADMRQQYAGLIGMDILSEYTLHVSPSEATLELIPSNISIEVPETWDRIDLMGNPFVSDRHNLHFAKVKINRKDVNFLIDTGSEVSVMNWKAANFSVMKTRRQRLKKEWELAGANGSFSPALKLHIGRLESGQKEWFEKDVIVMDLDGLDVLGVHEAPFMIGGVGLFTEETFILDFERNLLAFKPTPQQLEIHNPFIISYDNIRGPLDY